MANEQRKSRRSRRNDNQESPIINLEGLDADETRPDMAITAWSRNGECLHSAVVAEDGSFSFPADILENTHLVRIGPENAEVELLEEVALTYRADQFRKVLEVGVINVARAIWDDWFIHWRCVTGRVRVCRRSPWWYADLIRFATLPLVAEHRQFSPSIETRALALPTTASASLEQSTALVPSSRISPAASLDELIAWPLRCAPVCRGTVEVYRRTCCCKPWVFLDPRLDGLIRDLEDLIRDIPQPYPPLPDPPGPGPDPAPFAQEIFFKDGALDEIALRAAQDLKALRALPAQQIPTYINARPYLLCRCYSCSLPVKVAEGPLGPNGRFNICWLDFPRIQRPGCHNEYSYVVKQSFGAFTITIYNGLAANRWHHAGDDPTLTSYHPLAYGCRTNPGGAEVYLDVIGETGAHELITPDADGPDSVQSPVSNSGLVFPVPGPKGHNRNWGGTLKLSYMFTEGIQDVGAKFYRISVVEADAAGNPIESTRHYLDAGLSWNKNVSGHIIPVSLGPISAGTGADTQNFLYQIPFDTNPTTDWNADQYHAYLNTNDPRWSNPEKRHLVMLEIFDKDGQRLRPTGRPATGLGGPETEAAFTYRRRYQETGSTKEVPYGALTHMFWWDNRDVVADIVSLYKSGFEFNAECLFFGGTPDSTFGVGYRAYHPEEKFQLSHSIKWRRGLGSTAGSQDTLQPSKYSNVGKPSDPPDVSATNTFGDMLRLDLDPTRLKCAFTAFLDIWNKRTDGDNLGYDHKGDTAAFVLEIDS